MQSPTALDITYSPHKGTNSTNLIVGGSTFYTGAPYFASLASHRSGFDLSYIMSNYDAIQPLKILLPESVVMPIKVVPWVLDRINVCIIGPGLGRVTGEVEDAIKAIIAYLMAKDIFFIFDGDGIHLFNGIRGMFESYDKIVLTPNHNEAKKLDYNHKWFVVKKGPVDEIRHKKKVVLVNELGCEKRCGGLGDILCGVLALFLVKNETGTVECIAMACKVVRKASNMAYARKGRGLMASDVIEDIAGAFSYYQRIH